MTAPAAPGNPGVPGPQPISPPDQPPPSPQAAQPQHPPGPPPVPQGPGVVPPFAGPPTQRDTKRLWIGLGAGAVVVVLCCVGGLAGFGVMLAGFSKQAEYNARTLTTSYLTSVSNGDYRGAYQMLCDDITRRTNLRSFINLQRMDPMTDFTVAEDVLLDEGVTDSGSQVSEYLVRASVTYQRAGAKRRTYVIRGTLEGMTVCGER